MLWGGVLPLLEPFSEADTSGHADTGCTVHSARLGRPPRCRLCGSLSGKEERNQVDLVISSNDDFNHFHCSSRYLDYH